MCEQTPQLYRKVASRNNGIIMGNQLPLNNTRVKSTIQSCVNTEEPFNHEHNNYTLEQTQQFHNEAFTPEDSAIEENQLPIPSTNIALGPPNNENKKNVQFQPPISD